MAWVYRWFGWWGTLSSRGQSENEQISGNGDWEKKVDNWRSMEIRFMEIRRKGMRACWITDMRSVLTDFKADSIGETMSVKTKRSHEWAPSWSLIIGTNWRSRILLGYQWLFFDFYWRNDQSKLSFALFTVHPLEYPQWSIVGPERHYFGPSSMGFILSPLGKKTFYSASIGFSLDTSWWRKDQRKQVLECFVISHDLGWYSPWGQGTLVLILSTRTLLW